MNAVTGGTIMPFAPAGKAGVVFFVATDCPVSNSYAPEIQRVCREYGPRGVGCSLIYEDVDVHPTSAPLVDRLNGTRSPSDGLSTEIWRADQRAARSRDYEEIPLDKQVRAHLQEYGYASVPAAVDRDRTAATAAKATITPLAVVVDRGGDIRYRGRIDNLYAALGKRRQQVTSHDLRDALDAVLSGRRVQNPETEALGCYITDPALLRPHSHE
jgi:hypothetical protein